MARKPDHLRKSIKINKGKIRIPNGFHPYKVEEVTNEKGKAEIILYTKDNKTAVLDLIKEVEKAIAVCKTTTEKEEVCRMYSSEVDDWTNKSIALNKHRPINKLNCFHFRDAMKAKGYYRADN